jgi:hypothetical protein
MGFEALLSVIDHYVAVKSEPVKAPALPMSDWDCGLATEFESSYAEVGRRDQLDKARAALETALNDYIDERVQAAIGRDTRSLQQT